VKQASEKMNELFNKIIEEKKKGSGENKGDILDKLLEGLEKDKTLSNVEVISDIFIFFLAGHETTATALSWATAELAARQDIQEKLYQEIKEKYGDEPPSFEEISKGNPPYLDWFILENMRVHPPVSFIFTRISTMDIPYKDQVIPKGTRVGLGIERIHHHPDHWEKPEEFDPLRFSPDRKKGRHKFAYLPFSLGSRQCIGNDFSEIEQRLFLVRLLQKFKINLPKNLPPVNLKSIKNFSRTDTFYNISLEPRK
jgi:cytochrome P450